MLLWTVVFASTRVFSGIGAAENLNVLKAPFRGRAPFVGEEANELSAKRLPYVGDDAPCTEAI